MIVDQQNTARSHMTFFIPNVYYVCAVNSHVDMRKDKAKIIILKVNK